jgi:5-(carboxyamino)imidazole ribonucleotide synthase
MSQRVGVIGGGQLARMMIPAATNLGLEFSVLAESDESSARLAATTVGDYTDVATVLAFARGCDVITFDHEHVPAEVLSALDDAGVVMRPAPHALRFAQDKLAMRERLRDLGVPQPDWARARSASEVDAFVASHSGRAVAKQARGGYDGKGVRFISSSADVLDWCDGHDDMLLEEAVSFRRELAQLIARRPSGETALWPVVETVQANGVCAEVIAPAPGGEGPIEAMAAEIAARIAGGLDVTGVLAVELFETTDERILVNELAMRPHNSGHWSIEGAVTSQFEQHLRAVLDLPLGSTALRGESIVMVNILGGPSQGALADRLPQALERHPEAKVHLYGKTPRPGRKVGHVTVLADILEDAVAQARGAAGFFQD